METSNAAVVALEEIQWIIVYAWEILIYKCIEDS